VAISRQKILERGGATFQVNTSEERKLDRFIEKTK